jgi:hypothetical protein
MRNKTHAAQELSDYELELARTLGKRMGNAPLTQRLVEELCRMGVIDHTLCRVLAVRTWVDARVKSGRGKVESMWMAASHFCATFEYVRKCMYYYQNVNL